MNWLQPVDAYCERLAPGLWAEPVNLLTNAAFLLAAGLMWRRCRGLGTGRLLAAVLGLIGLGSGLFHSFANPLTGMMDVLPILGFILIYVHAATRDFLRAGPWLSAGAVLAFLPYAAVTGGLAGQVAPGLGGSAGYVPVPILIAAYAVALRRRAPATARGLALGAGLLALSLAFRTLDGPICAAVPLGTHFLWHLLNAIMLAWMIEVWRRHRLAGGGWRG